MAESYQCKGELVHFTNGGAELLQENWIEIGKELISEHGVTEILERLEKENLNGQGNRAYGIDETNEDFTTPEPILRWYEINEQLLNEIKRQGLNCRLFQGNGDCELLDNWIKRLTIISDALTNEYEKAKQRA